MQAVQASVEEIYHAFQNPDLPIPDPNPDCFAALRLAPRPMPSSFLRSFGKDVYDNSAPRWETYKWGPKRQDNMENDFTRRAELDEHFGLNVWLTGLP